MKRPDLVCRGAAHLLGRARRMEIPPARVCRAKRPPPRSAARGDLGLGARPGCGHVPCPDGPADRDIRPQHAALLFSPDVLAFGAGVAAARGGWLEPLVRSTQARRGAPAGWAWSSARSRWRPCLPRAGSSREMGSANSRAAAPGHPGPRDMGAIGRRRPGTRGPRILFRLTRQGYRACAVARRPVVRRLPLPSRGARPSHTRISAVCPRSVPRGVDAHGGRSRREPDRGGSRPAHPGISRNPLMGKRSECAGCGGTRYAYPLS